MPERATSCGGHPLLTAAEEAALLLRRHEGKDGINGCLQTLAGQFNVIQTRSQLLLTLATLALTITGFSGPKIAATNLFARLSMGGGLLLVLAAVVLILTGSMRMQWVTQICGDTDQQTLERILGYRNSKVRLFRIELTLLVLGLAAYVASVITYLVFGL